MSDRVTQWQSFDPEFDDTEWTDGWLHVPIAQAPPGKHASGYWVERRILQYTEIFGKPYRLSAPLTCRLLFDPDGRLWMSDTPQERIMMYNNGRRTWGQVLVGGLGLGLYPQFAAVGAVGRGTHFTVIERSPVVRDIVEPTLSVALETPLEVRTGDIMAYLSGSVSMRFDTIFLDTWDTLDAVHLPAINRMRDLALRHLAPGGQVLLWGYRWMVRLFEEACRHLLDVAPGQRATWLMAQAETSPRAVALMTPVVEHLGAREGKDVEEVLVWCRQYIEQRVEPV